MAGIITEVKSDIQRLKELKAAIDDVKKSIKDIDINIDVNIAKDLEPKLKSLIAQYDELAFKIIKTEAAIANSVKNIVGAAAKIIQAQEKLSKAVKISTQTRNTNSQAINAAETATIQVQAKAYDKLKTEINDILGTREANVKRMIDEINAIRLINAEIKKITKLQGEYSTLSSAQRARLEQLNNSLLTHKAALSEVRQTLDNNVKLDNAAATSMDGLSQSLSRMRIAYRGLTEEERNSPFGKELLASINQADVKIKELDATIGNHQRNVGNYKAQWNGLNMSIQQVGRELPSLAYGPKVFFSAISNNLPILADEIKRARTEYELLKKSGQSAIPVWKQIITSLFSWQTALTVGITLLTLYGDKIVDWVGGLFQTKKALSETYQTTEEFQKSIVRATGLMLTTIEKLSAGWVKLGGDIKAQKKYILDNKKAFDSTGVAIQSVSDAENLLVQNKDAFIRAITEKAKATAVMELASKEYEKYIQKMLEAEVMPEGRTRSYWNYAGAANGGFQKISFYEKNQKKIDTQKEAEGYRKSMVSLIHKAMGYDEESRKEIEKAGGKLSDILIEGSVGAIKAAIAKKQQELEKVTNPKVYKRIEAEIKAEQAKLDAITGKLDTETAKRLKAQQELSRSILDSELKLQADRIAIMKDGKDKRVLLADQEYKETLATIRKQKEEYQKKVKEAGQREDPAVMATFDSRESAARSKRDTDVASINKEYFDDYAKRTKALTDVFLSEEKKRLSAVKERYNEERKWANEQLKTGGMSEDQYQSYVINIDKAEAEESLRSLLDKYQDYATERKRIEEQFQAEIETLEKGRTQNNAASVDAAIAEARKKEREALSNLDLDNLQKEIDWSTVFGDLEKVSTSTLRRLQEQLKNYLSSVGDTISKEDLKVVTDALTQIGEVQADRRPIDELKSGYESYTQACEKVAAAQQKVNELEAKGDKTSEDYKKAVKGLTAAQDERRSSLVSMTQAVNSMGQKGGELVQAGSDITGMLTDLGVKIPESIAGALDGLGQIASSLSSIDLTKPFSIITGITGMIGGIGKAIGSLFNKDHKKEKNIERLQVQVEELDKSYEKLSDSIEKAYSVDASELIEQQNQMLEQQKLLIQQQIAEEESKKHSDNDRIKEWKNQLEDIDKTLADNEEKAKDAIFGEDLKSAIDNFANAYAEAWAAGEDRAASMKDVARNMIKQTVIELIKSSAGLGETVKKIREMILGFLSDGVVDEWEQRELDSYIESETARLDAKYSWADKYMKEDKGIDLGISGDSLADTIVEGLRAGKAGIKDFSGSFEEMMKTAILNSLKAKYLEGPLKEFQKKFAALSESGGQLTEAEIEELRAMYAEIIDGAKVQFDSLKEISGLDFLDDSDNTLKGAFAKASQESIDLLAGQAGAQRAAIEAIREMFRFIYELQKQGWQDVRIIRDLTTKVDKNTALVAENTREIRAIAQNISENTKQTVETLDSIDNRGIKVKM